MPIELVGKEQVRRIRPFTPAEDALNNARQLSRSLGDRFDFEPHMLEVDGNHIHYVDEGPRDADPILCLHGNPTWSYYWRDLIRGMREKQRVIAPDHMGMGLSEKPHDFPYCLESHVSVLEHLVQELDLKNITLVLHDWGGAIGMGMAMRHPERIKRIVITNTAAFTDGPAHASIMTAKIPGLGSMLVRTMGLFNAAAMQFCSTSGLSENDRHAYMAPYGNSADRIGVHEFVRDIPLSPTHPSFNFLAIVEAGLKQFAELPVQIIWGMKDWVFTPEFLRMWQERFPKARTHTIAHAGHLLMDDAGAEVLEVLREFLSETAQ